MSGCSVDCTVQKVQIQLHIMLPPKPQKESLEVGRRSSLQENIFPVAKSSKLLEYLQPRNPDA